MLQRARPQEKVQAGNDEFCLRALCTRQLQMLLLRGKEFSELSVKLDEVSELFFKMPKLQVMMSVTL